MTADPPATGSAYEAEIIALEKARRRAGAARNGAAGAPRCGVPTEAGAPCRNPARDSGFCRLHEPDELAALHRLHPTRLEATWSESELAAEVDAAIEAVLAFLRRRVTGDYDVDVYGFDRELTEQVLLPIGRALYRRYWRIDAVGVEHLPSETGALLVANHAGTVPFDAIMTKVAVYDEHPAHRHLRMLAADLALRLPMIGPLARKFANTLAHVEDARRLLADDELVAVWPEGYKGIGKRYRDRYKLQRFGRGGFVEVALRTQRPIVPVAIIGSEEIYPMVANVGVLARLLGFPYFPITWQFPLLGPLGVLPLPSKWVIEFGEPIDTRAYGPDAAEDAMTVFELTDRVRDTIQQMLYRNLMGRRSIFR